MSITIIDKPTTLTGKIGEQAVNLHCGPGAMEAMAVVPITWRSETLPGCVEVIHGGDVVIFASSAELAKVAANAVKDHASLQNAKAMESRAHLMSDADVLSAVRRELKRTGGVLVE